MKKTIAILLIFSVLLLGVPYLWKAKLGIEAAASIPDRFRLKITETGEIVELDAIDYVTGCLFAQIPINYHEEALKAQAVIAHTYAQRLYLNNLLHPSAENTSENPYDLTDDPATNQPYYTAEKAKALYGTDYDLYFNTIRLAAEYGISQVMQYNNEPINAVYHAVSTGFTNNPRAVWGREFPYLKPVSSEWDKSYPYYECTNELPVDEMRVMLSQHDPDISLPIDYNRWFSEMNINEHGYVETIKLGSKAVTGGDVWRIFNLRSPSFTITYNGMAFTCTTKGYGHGVGLSQYGANYMAQKGYTCTDILNYYYTDITLKPL